MINKVFAVCYQKDKDEYMKWHIVKAHTAVNQDVDSSLLFSEEAAESEQRVRPQRF